MKQYSVWFVDPFRVEVRESDMPVLGADEVLVQTAVSAISPGTEMLVYRGEWPPDLPVDATIEALGGGFAYPLKYGYACVGEVIDIGQNVAAAWRNRHVFAFNPHENYFIAKPENLLILPEGMPPETAVFLPNMETAVSFVMDAQPVIGEQVVIFGQGIVGLLTTMLLADFPLAQLVTVEGLALRREWSEKLGATAVFTPDDDQLKALDVDLALELSGNPAALDAALAVVGFNGRILVGSWYGQKRAALDLGGSFHRNHIQIFSSQVSHLNPKWNGRWDKNRRLQLAWQMLAKHNPTQLITHRFDVHDAGLAYETISARAETAVQVILTYKRVDV